MSIENVSWKLDEFFLRDLSIQIKRGALVALVGRTGSGKSIFLSALLGKLSFLL